MKKSLAFTLIELLVVIAVIGILSGLVVVSMSGVTDKATIAKGKVFSSSLRNSLMSNLISEWKFNNNTNDSWNGTNNGSWSGSAGINTTANWRPLEECVSGQCLDFDGYDDNISLGSDSSLTVASNWTFEHWMKWPGQASACVFYAGIGGTQPNFLVKNCSGGASTFAYRPAGGAESYHAFVSSAEYINKWTHVSWTANDNNNISLYINGQFAISKNLVSPYTTSMSLRSIGRSYGGTSYSFLGKIDEARFYNIKLSSFQIKERYFSGLNNLLSSKQITKDDYLLKIEELAKDLQNTPI